MTNTINDINMMGEIKENGPTDHQNTLFLISKKTIKGKPTIKS